MLRNNFITLEDISFKVRNNRAMNFSLDLV